MILYEFKDYKRYVKNLLSVTGKTRGQRSKLASALGCQTGFISQVLNGNTHFSMEHALKISKFLNHNNDESHFFMLLVQYQKAGTVELQSFFLKQIEEIIEKRKEIKSRINTNKDLDEKAFLTYYSNWYYAAIHVLTSIPEFQAIEAIADKLKLSTETVTDVLYFLEKKGLIVNENRSFKITNKRIHLPRKSKLISKHHINWRLESIKSLERNNDDNLHYSSALSMSLSDFNKIKTMILKMLEDIEPILVPSPEEEFCSLNIDFFKY